MPPYRTGFVVVDVLETHRQFDAVVRKVDQGLAKLRGARTPAGQRAVALLQRERTRILLAYAQFTRELDSLATRSAANADAAIRKRLEATRQRPDTQRSGLRLADAIVSRPIAPGGFNVATGAVGIADIAELDKVVNPNAPGAGPYWRTQERGTTVHVNRRIHGLFFGPGARAGQPPRSIYAGGRGPHPIFIPAPRSAGGGPGVITAPIRPRWFIRDGARQAGVHWLAGLRRIETQALRAI